MKGGKIMYELYYYGIRKSVKIYRVRLSHVNIAVDVGMSR